MVRRKQMKSGILLGLLTILPLGCRSGQGDDKIETVGTVRFISLEGGFYGIIADDGTRYEPVELKEEFRIDGLRVRFTARPADEQVSFRMWGQRIEILTMEKR
jgi:hypothetical protein